MATYDRTSMAGVGLASVKRVKQTLDCVTNPLLITDIAQLIHVPANSFVAQLRWEVETVEGGAGTFDIGDGADPDGYIDGADANALGSGSMGLVLTEAAPNTVLGYSNGKYYAAADTIDLTAVAALDAAVIRVEAIIYTFDPS